MAQEVKGRNNGPYLISGTATYIDAEGNEQTTTGTTIALCRCGHSKNKPFCDGSHRSAGFEAAEVVLHLND
jgi:CDGSH-type Zn-finger protein